MRKSKRQKKHLVHLETATSFSSPRCSTVPQDELMPSKKHLPSRPLSLAIPVKEYSPRRPTLQEILANSAPPPWTLSAFTAYLSQNHCLENLEFTMDATLYRRHYETLLANCGEETIMASTEGCKYVRILWQKLLDAYITPNSPHEVNLPGDVRDRLLSSPNHFSPPSPLQLDSAIMVVYELMDESVLISFLNSVSRDFSTYIGPWTSAEDTSTIPTPDSPPMPPAASTQIGYGSTSSSNPSRDAQTSNSAHSHQPVQRSHLAAALKRGVKFIYPSPSSSSAKDNDSVTEYRISASSLDEFMIPLIIPPTYISFTDTSESTSKVSRADESDSKKMGWKLGLGLRKS